MKPTDDIRAFIAQALQHDQTVDATEIALLGPKATSAIPSDRIGSDGRRATIGVTGKQALAQRGPALALVQRTPRPFDRGSYRPDSGQNSLARRQHLIEQPAQHPRRHEIAPQPAQADQIAKALDGWAKANGVSRSEAIRRLVEAGLKRR